MAATRTAPMTVRNYRLLHEGGPRYWLIEGELLMAPAPSRHHQEIALRLALIIGNHLQKHPQGKLYLAPFDVYLDETNVFQPDLCFVANSSVSILTEEGAQGAPDLAIEILSPRTERLDRDTKRRVYARSGVKELWLVDPARKQIHVYYLTENPERPIATHSDEEVFTSPLLPGLTVEAQQIFLG